MNQNTYTVKLYIKPTLLLFLGCSIGAAIDQATAHASEIAQVCSQVRFHAVVIGKTPSVSGAWRSEFQPASSTTLDTFSYPAFLDEDGFFRPDLTSIGDEILVKVNEP